MLDTSNTESRSDHPLGGAGVLVGALALPHSNRVSWVRRLDEARRSGDGVLVDRGEVQVIHLPLLDSNVVDDVVARPRGDQRDASVRPALDVQRRAVEGALDEVISWLWQAVVEPVMSRLALQPIDGSRRFCSGSRPGRAPCSRCTPRSGSRPPNCDTSACWTTSRSDASS